MLAAPEVVLRCPRDVICDDQIQLAVIVVVKPSRARRPTPSVFDSCMSRYIFKSAVAVVVVQNATAIAEYEKIREPVVIVITHGHAHAKQPLCTDACAESHIR